MHLIRYKMKILFSLLFLLIITSFAYAGDWELIGNTRSGDTFYLDKSSVKKDGNLRTVNEKQVFKFAQISQNGNFYDQTVLVKIYDCSSMNFTIKEVTGQDRNGNTIFTDTFEKYYEGNPSKRWLKAGPGSLFRKSLDIVCK